MQYSKNIKKTKDVVIKTAPPELMRVEVEKTRRAYSIGKECGLFYVPAVLDYDEDRGMAVFEYLKNVRPFFAKTNKSLTIMEQIGISLASIHKNLILPSDMAIPLPQNFTLPGTDVFLHGDFNGCNVCIAETTPKIVIFDWSMTPRYGGTATYGSRYFDLFWFINYMLWSPKLKCLFSDPISPLARHYLVAYFHEANVSYEPDALFLYAKRLFDEEIKLRKEHPITKREKYLMPRILALIERYLKSLRTLRF